MDTEVLQTLNLGSNGLVSIEFLENENCLLRTYEVDRDNLLVYCPSKHAESACEVALGGHAMVSHFLPALDRLHSWTGNTLA